MSSKARNVIVDRLRAEGFAAHQAGKSILTCPHSAINDRKQWTRGWRDAQETKPLGICKFTRDLHAKSDKCENWEPVSLYIPNKVQQ